MEVPDMRNTQGTGANKMMTGHLRKEDTVGKTISNSLDALQIHAGTSWPVLSRDGTQVLRYVEGTDKTWATNLWKFNDQHEYMIRQNHRPWLLAQCEHDSFIMEKIAALPGINNTKLKAVQRCQLYLKAITISDLTNSAGTAIADWVTNPNLQGHESWPSLFLYPNQG
jgi:hypothetical protein